MKENLKKKYEIILKCILTEQNIELTNHRPQKKFYEIY